MPAMRVEGIKLKHKLLIDEFIRNGGNGAAAWRKIYGSHYTNPNIPSQSFYLYVRRPRIRAYLERKLQRMIKRGDISEESILTKYEEAYTMAKGSNKTADMISAATAQAKLVGMLRDRVETGPPGSFAGMEEINEVLDGLREHIGTEATNQIATALGIIPNSQEPEPKAQDVSPAIEDNVQQAASPAPRGEPERRFEEAVALFEADSPSDAVN